MLREEKGCKVILLLNEEGLGDEKAMFRKYLEKVVDQAIHYIPTPAESAAAALNLSNDLDAALARNTEQLGITNIRVIKRIRRFLGFLAPELKGLHTSITAQASRRQRCSAGAYSSRRWRRILLMLLASIPTRGCSIRRSQAIRKHNGMRY
jgi:hypothetical protein